MRYETGDVEQDYSATRGLTFLVAFQLVPLDLTGCTAVMSIAGVGDFAMTVQAAHFGAFAQGALSLEVAPATTSAWSAGIFDYQVSVTFPDASAFPMGHGKVQVR